ncbi:Cap15 family cyclic dinucleotide receptor domain-containing protein [Rhizobium leguminosarum]
MLEHEYTHLGGISRLNVGRCLGIASASVSAGIVYVLLWFVNIAQHLGWSVNLPPSVLSLVGAGVVFSVLAWLLNRHAWRWRFIQSLLQIPDLSGDWTCVGRTIETNTNPAYAWDGKITIVQSWDKIRIRLKTDTSASNSKSAALIKDEADGWRLFYSYGNEPKIDHTALHTHKGFAEILFGKDLKSGEGEYFNGHGRYTFGTMKLEKIDNG